MHGEHPPAKRRSPWGLTGVIVACLALAAAFLSPWIAETLDPSPSLEEIVADKAVKIKEAVKAKLSGKEYVAERASRVRQVLPPSIIATGLAGAALGLISFLRSEARLFGTSAMTIGIAAVVVQWMVLLAVAILALLILYVVVALLTGGGVPDVG